MRRILTVIALLLCCAALFVPVFAASQADTLRAEAVVSPDGRCEITVTMSLRLEGSVSELNYPIPSGATEVTVNGVSTRPERKGNVRLVDLTEITGGFAGLYTITIHYTLPDVVLAQEERIFVEIPLLSGFTYPIAAMDFSVTLPGNVEFRPSFTSGYYQESIESNLTFQTVGANVSGNLDIALKDRETLCITLEVPEDMFPRSVTVKYDNTMGIIAMGVFFLLALGYYLLTMCPSFPFPHRTTNPPAGITAGEAGSYLCGGGVSLTMLVLSWAQMGYLQIQPEKDGRILLHKRMEMGNERSSFEIRCFQELFGRRDVIDGTGSRYALLSQKVAHKCPAARDIFRRSSGNPLIFRGLSTLLGVSGGVAMALSLVQEPTARVLLSILFGSLCGAASWLIQEGSMYFLLRAQLRKLLALAGVLVTAILGILAGQLLLALIVILLQIAAGVAAALGGRRTELGKQTLSQFWGLRRFMQRGKDDALPQILRYNPEFFFDLAPYAIALGVDRVFANKFGTLRLPSCPYLTVSTGRLTVEEWRRLLRKTVDALERVDYKPPKEAGKKKK